MQSKQSSTDSATDALSSLSSIGSYGSLSRVSSDSSTPDTSLETANTISRLSSLSALGSLSRVSSYNPEWSLSPHLGTTPPALQTPNGGRTPSLGGMPNLMRGSSLSLPMHMNRHASSNFSMPSPSDHHVQSPGAQHHGQQQQQQQHPQQPRLQSRQLSTQPPSLDLPPSVPGLSRIHSLTVSSDARRLPQPSLSRAPSDSADPSLFDSNNKAQLTRAQSNQPDNKSNRRMIPSHLGMSNVLTQSSSNASHVRSPEDILVSIYAASPRTSMMSTTSMLSADSTSQIDTKPAQPVRKTIKRKRPPAKPKPKKACVTFCRCVFLCSLAVPVTKKHTFVVMHVSPQSL